MNIKMIGLDHIKTPLEYREKISFSATRVSEFLNLIKEKTYVSGAVLISTCNRTELYISYKSGFIGQTEEIKNLIFRFKNIKKDDYKNYIEIRENKEAIEHLFMVTAGLKSQILGEEQIITQVKNAKELSKDAQILDTKLEVLFRKAITASKKVKTEIQMKQKFSIVDSAINKIKSLGIEIKGKKCLVIGNGEMGRLASSTLIKNNAKTYMTLRQHHGGEVLIPVGVEIIKFGDRIKLLPEFDIIFSTTSTNRYMVRYDDLSGIELKGNMIFIDLAMPRDIDEKISILEGVTVFNIDDFELDKREIEELDDKVLKVKEILLKYIDDFYNWDFNKDLNQVAIKISQKVAEDTVWRVKGDIKDEEILKNIESASKKAIDKLIFSLRDSIENEEFEKLLKNIKKSYIERD